MKKIKIMLLSLALFAVVGGALAFKAKFNTKFCTVAAVDNGGGNYTCPALCPIPIIGQQLTNANVAFVCTTDPYAIDDVTATCTSNVLGGGITTTACDVTPTKIDADQ